MNNNKVNMSNTKKGCHSQFCFVWTSVVRPLWKWDKHQSTRVLARETRGSCWKKSIFPRQHNIFEIERTKWQKIVRFKQRLPWKTLKIQFGNSWAMFVGVRKAVNLNCFRFWRLGEQNWGTEAQECLPLSIYLETPSLETFLRNNTT